MGKEISLWSMFSSPRRHGVSTGSCLFVLGASVVMCLISGRKQFQIAIDVLTATEASSGIVACLGQFGCLAFALVLHQPAGELSNEAKVEFLRTAVAVKAEKAGKGITETWRVKLEGSGMTHDASFQYVDERAAVKDLGDGNTELQFVDSYRYNVAGYRLAELLGLGHMVPVSVERQWRGNRGAMTWWVDDVEMDEAEMKERGLKAPDPAEWTRQTYRVRVFNELIYDTDRNQGNLLITGDWKIWMIDFSRAFRRWPKLRRPELLMRCDRQLFSSISGLTRDRLDADLSDILDENELDGLWARRDLIVAHFESLVAERGATEVLY